MPSHHWRHGVLVSATGCCPHPQSPLLPPQTVRFLAETLGAEGHRCVELHGERSQAEREEAVRAFRSGKVQVSAERARWGPP